MIRAMKPAIAGAIVLATLAACQRENGGYAGGALDTTRVSASTPDSTSSSAMMARTAWSSPAILGFAATANSGEILLGKLAEMKATHPEVKAFAHQMVRDHQAMLDDTKKLATKLGAVLDTTADAASDLANDARDEIRDLADKAPGRGWDEDYMEAMVEGHEKVLNHLQDAAKNANAAELRSALDAAAAKVQAHLAKAREIKAKID
jgi:putative membrane protein